MAHISGTLVWGQLPPLAPEKAGISCGKGVGEQSYFFIVGGKEKREGRREGKKRVMEEERKRERERRINPSEAHSPLPSPFFPPARPQLPKSSPLPNTPFNYEPDESEPL